MKPTKLFGLGGMQEIGKSTLVIEKNNSIIIIDSGIKFADSFVTGIKGVIPDYGYLKENQDKIQGVFITHGHEDHIGGIPFLVQQVNVKRIYAPKIAVQYLKLKFEEKRIRNKVEFIEIEKDLVIDFSDVKVDFWTAQHSIPDAFGIRVQTEDGSIMCTGDFRFDYTPIGNLTDFSKLEQMGKEDLTVLLSDSTNAMRPMHSPSEKDILKDIEDLFRSAEKKIILTAFASNLTRLTAIIELAAKLEKKVVIFGRSMVNGINIGRKLGYLNVPDTVFVDKKNISKYQDNELLILTTGSQGERLAALAKMATGKHPQISIKHNDMIIFSSSPIPGNRMKIELLVNKLYKLGAIIKENGVDGYLHTSGHAYQEEHDKIFQTTKPTYFVPYHGEYRMSVVHGNTAEKNGVDPKNIIIPRNGEVLYLKNKKLTISKETIEVGPVYVEGDVVSKSNTQTIKERVLLGESGFVNVIVAIDKNKNTIIGRPRIVSRGSFYVKTSTELVEECKKIVHRSILFLIKNSPDWSIPQIKKLVKERLESYIYKEKRRKPVILTSILMIDKKAKQNSNTPKPVKKSKNNKPNNKKPLKEAKEDQNEK
ncbi:ribonuclease J [Mycoplasma iguanae]|uniref:Ribonuclease J n=1 Tax=Mycoplasma iguanae TaxID=292461 RepID=A0ABY5R8K0_9MOLU|nr:ribonuclease J [Mycoplasma iguanae]UVD81641.1 ribonuclease J [Mycoplasma iguanae]